MSFSVNMLTEGENMRTFQNSGERMLLIEVREHLMIRFKVYGEK